MKKTIFILFLAIPVAAGLIFTGYGSATQGQKDTHTNLPVASRELNAVQKMAEAEEWEAFRYESEVKIYGHEMQIAELKTAIKTNEKIFDAIYLNKVAILSEQMKFVKARLENYDNGPANWKSFRNSINHEMNTIEKSLIEISVYKK